MVQDGIWLLILFSQKNLFKLADCSSLVLRLKSTGRILSFIVQHHHNSFVVPVSMKQVVGHVCLEAFLDLYQRSDIKASVWKTIILYKNKCSSTSPSSFHTNLATLFFTFFYYSEKICLCPNSFVLFLLSFSLSLWWVLDINIMKKKVQGFSFFFFSSSLQQNDFGTRWRLLVNAGGSLQSLVCAFEHENGVGDLEGGSQLDAHDLHNVGLGQQQESLAVNHLTTQTQGRWWTSCIETSVSQIMRTFENLLLMSPCG